MQIPARYVWKALERRTTPGCRGKRGVKIERENLTCATISIQNYFRMYSKLVT
ncbi:MAG: hypothetical protein ACLUKN_02375 [Bacilli bacterium]